MGSNPTGSNSDRLVSITRIDGYIMSDKYKKKLKTVGNPHSVGSVVATPTQDTGPNLAHRTKPFDYQTVLNHTNAKLVHYSHPHCNLKKLDFKHDDFY